jgi:3-mercaptopyruvate sulfurtransferase SseA
VWQVTALEIQALKRINKSSQVLLLDKNGAGPAKAVAKELSRLGFQSVFIISGGFTAWAQSKLQIRRPVCPVKKL